MALHTILYQAAYEIIERYGPDAEEYAGKMLRRSVPDQDTQLQ